MIFALVVVCLGVYAGVSGSWPTRCGSNCCRGAGFGGGDHGRIERKNSPPP